MLEPDKDALDYSLPVLRANPEGKQLLGFSLSLSLSLLPLFLQSLSSLSLSPLISLSLSPTKPHANNLMCVLVHVLVCRLMTLTKFSISTASGGGDRGVHAESHMTGRLIRENETHLGGQREGAGACHSKLAAGPILCLLH